MLVNTSQREGSADCYFSILLFLGDFRILFAIIITKKVADVFGPGPKETVKKCSIISSQPHFYAFYHGCISVKS